MANRAQPNVSKNRLTDYGSRPWFLHPAVLFYSIWLGVWFLYSIRLSSLLLFPNDTVSSIELPLLGGFIPGLVLSLAFPGVLLNRKSRIDPYRAGELLDKRLTFWFKVWAWCSVGEIIVSGGIPVLWSLVGSSKNYFDFGIPSVHGLLNALILAISACRFAIGLRSGRKKDLLFPLLCCVWSILAETRQMLTVILVECVILFFTYRRLQLKRALWAIAFFIAAIVLFGVLGDFRSGGEAFRTLAQPTDRYPGWLPSGFLWVYVYATTPLNNLVNTFLSTIPHDDLLLKNTISNLFPSVIRQPLYGNEAAAEAFTGELISGAFNVSTAYVGPLQDWGLAGVAGFSAFMGLVTGFYWRLRNFRSQLIFAVVAQCLMLTIFYNLIFYLPVIAQVAWIFLFFRKTGGEAIVLAEPARRKSSVPAHGDLVPH